MSSVVIIGAASGKGQDYIQAILDKPYDAKIVAVVINKTMPKQVEEWANKYQWKVIRDGNVQELIDTTTFDTAIISLPHDQHYTITKLLLENGAYVIKEKPLGISVNEGMVYKELIKEKKCVPMYTTVQRSTHPLFVEAKQDLALIGSPTQFTYTYAFSLPNQTSGWRADLDKCGGGVVIDMGYHALDVVNDFFGYPKDIKSAFSYKFPEFEKIKLEDAAEITLTYDGFTGKVLLDRHAQERSESFEIVGEKGKIILTPTSYELILGEVQSKKVAMSLTKTEVIHRMFEVALASDKDGEKMQKQFDKNIDTMRMIDTIYDQKNRT